MKGSGENMKDIREKVKSAILRNFDEVSDPPVDGQMVDGKWYAPIWGCDTLDSIIDDVILAEHAEASTLKAQRDLMIAICNDMLEDLDSFDGPEKYTPAPFAHFTPAGRMLDMKHAAKIRSAIASMKDEHDRR